MNPKTSFGYDFLYLMRSLQLAGSKKKGFDPIADAASRYFLITWGLTPEEADDANKHFWEDVQRRNLSNFKESFERIVNHMKKDRAALDRLVVQATAIASLDFDVTPDEATFIHMFQDYFDLRPSEWKALVKQGTNLAIALHYFGGTYADNRPK